MPRAIPYRSCTIKKLPEKDQYAAAQFACSLNPVNRAVPEILNKLGIEASRSEERLAIAVSTSKFFGATGVSLTVSFLEQTSAALADKILSHMNAWSVHCNAKFTMYSGAAAKAQVRISRGLGGYWSYLGSDVLRITQGPTMNLQGFTINTSESEYRRVVRHETAHTLGCPHEHARPEIVARLNVQATIAYFQRTQGWTASEVRQQVLTPLSEQSLMGTPHAEEDSIMCYGLPASITNDGRPIPGGLDITANDGAFMGKVYPLAISPPSPPPPSPPSNFTLKQVAQGFDDARARLTAYMLANG